MIITRSPLRITLGGGGTDLPSYYREHGGFLIAAAIDKYVYVTVMRPFTPGSSQVLQTGARRADCRGSSPDHQGGARPRRLSDTPGRDHHARRHSGRHGPGVIRQFHDSVVEGALRTPPPPAPPKRTGRTRLPDRDRQTARAHWQARLVHRSLRRPHVLHVSPRRRRRSRASQVTHRRDVRSRRQPLTVLYWLFTDSRQHLADQKERTGARDADMLSNLHYVKDLGLRSRKALESGDTAAFGALMHEHWEHKKRRTSGMSNPQIDEWYELGRRHGALGGKLVGAGGGGFLMFYSEDHRRLRSAMASAGLEEVRFRFDFEGTKVLFA